MSVIMESTFELKFGTFERFEAAMRGFIPGLEGEGWRLIAALRHTTGDITTARHLWEIPSLESLNAAPSAAIAKNPAILEAAADATEIVRTEKIRFLSPREQDPSVTGERPDPSAPVFQRVAFDLEFGSIERFDAAMRHIIPALSEQGWRLIASLRNLTGDVYDAVNLWALPDLASLHAAGPKARAAHPELAEIVEDLKPILRTETIDLLAPLAHHPAG